MTYQAALSDKDQYIRGLADLDYLYVDSLSYELLSSKKMREIDHFNIMYESIDTGKDPLANYDKDFGPIESGRDCSSCKSPSCQGHMGLLQFPMTHAGCPVMIINPSYEDIVKKILCIMCLTCQKLAFDEKDISKKGKLDGILRMPRSHRLKALYELLKSEPKKKVICPKDEVTKDGYVMICTSCHVMKREEKGTVTVCRIISIAPSDQTEESTSGGRIKGKSKKEEGSYSWLSPREIYDKFMLIGGRPGHTRDCDYLGITKSELEGMFMTSILLLPTKFRPRLANRKNCDLTTEINKIVSTARDYKEGEPKKFIGLLYKAVSGYIQIVNKIPGSKTGLLNSNIYGKRPEFNGRAVAIPSPFVDVNEIEIPRILAERGLVREEDVFEETIEAQQELMYSGKISHIEKLIGPNSGRRVRVAQDNISDISSHTLAVGDKIWRHLRDGDVIVPGRQPTVNKTNVFGAAVKIVEGHTIGVDIGVTPGAGLDYDGDTLHVSRAQMNEADDEIMNMFLGKNIRSDQRNTPVFGLVYNAPVAAALLTFQQIEISKGLYNDSIITYFNEPRMKTLDDRLRKHGVEKYSGHGLFSTVLPENFSYENGPGPKHIVIKDGILIEGMLTGTTVGSAAGGIVDKMSNMYAGCGSIHCAFQCKSKECTRGWEITNKYIANATRMLAKFIDGYGFSVSYADMLFGTSENISILQEEKQDEARRKILNMKRPKTSYEKARYEKDIMSIVNDLNSTAAQAGIFSGLDKVPSVIVRQALDKVSDEIAEMQRDDKQTQRAEIFRILYSLGPELAPIGSSEIETELNRVDVLIEKASAKLEDAKHTISDIKDIINFPEEKLDLPSSSLDKAAEDIYSGLDPYVVLNSIVKPYLFPHIWAERYILSNMKFNRVVFRLINLRYSNERDYRRDVRNIVENLRTVPSSAFVIEGQMIGTNALIFMSKLVSGAKGAEGNLTNIGVSLGQSLLFGKRLVKGITGESRMFVTQRPDSMFLEHKGYIENSYVIGLTPNQAVQASISGRFGLAATNTMTRTIGAMQKKIDKLFQDVTIINGSAVYRGSVVLNFAYGEDSMDGRQLLLENSSFQCASLNDIASLINSEYT